MTLAANVGGLAVAPLAETWRRKPRRCAGGARRW